MYVTRFREDMRFWYAEYCDTAALHDQTPSVKEFLEMVALVLDGTGKTD